MSAPLNTVLSIANRGLSSCLTLLTDADPIHTGPFVEARQPETLVHLADGPREGGGTETPSLIVDDVTTAAVDTG